MPIVEFGPFSLDDVRCELRMSGELIRVQPKVFDFLSYLVRQCDRVVSKEELLEHVWPDAAVTETSISRTVAILRRALGDDPRSPRWIATLHGRGYRFVGELRELPTTRAVALPPERAQAGFDAHRELLVGRQTEQVTLREALRATASGSGKALLVEGEAGIGKSRLLEWCAEEAVRLGVEPILSRCREDEGAPALLPWIGVVRQLAKSGALGASLLEANGPSIPLAYLFPEVFSGDPKPPDGSDPSGLRFQGWEALADLLGELGAQRPLALLFDDMNRADASSVALLEFLIHRLAGAPVLFVVSTRPPASEDDVAARMARDTHCAILPLSGIGEDDVLALVSAAQPALRSHELAARIWHQTAGNPFFIHQIIPFLTPSELESSEAGSLAVALPPTARRAVERACVTLSDAALEVLRAGSVLGRELAAALLSEVLERPTDHVLAAMDEGVAARLLIPIPAQPHHYRFAHLLVRDVLYEGLSSHRRALLHGRAAVALESLSGITDRAAEIAHHFAASATESGVKKAADYCVAAGARAVERLAHDAAIAHYERAVALLDSLPDPDRGQRSDLLRDLAHQLRYVGRPRDAWNACVEAAEQARAIGDAGRLTRAALQLSVGLDVQLHSPTRVIELIEEATKTSDASDRVERARLLSRLAQVLDFVHREAESDGARIEALRLASETKDPLAMAEALISDHTRLRGTPLAEARERVATEVVRYARLAHSTEISVIYQGFRLVHLAELGRFRECDDGIEQLHSQAVELNSPSLSAFACKLSAMRLLMQGRFAEALGYTQRAIAATRGDPSVVGDLRTQILAVAYDQGRIRAEDLPDSRSDWRAARLPILKDLGRFKEISQTLEYVLRGGFARHRSTTWIPMAVLLVQGIAFVKDTERAVQFREWLNGFGPLHVIADGGMVYMGPMRRYTGLLDACLGRWPEAIDSLQSALQESVMIEAPVFQARIHLDLAQVQRDTHAPGRQAAFHAREALDLARRLGLGWVERQARELLDQVR